MGVEGLFFAVEAFIVAIAVALAAFIADSLAIKSWQRWPSLQTYWASNHDDNISMVTFIADSLGVKSWWHPHGGLCCRLIGHHIMMMTSPWWPLLQTHWESNHDDDIPMVAFVADTSGIKSWWWHLHGWLRRRLMSQKSWWCTNTNLPAIKSWQWNPHHYLCGKLIKHGFNIISIATFIPDVLAITLWWFHVIIIADSLTIKAWSCMLTSSALDRKSSPFHFWTSSC